MQQVAVTALSSVSNYPLQQTGSSFAQIYGRGGDVKEQGFSTVDWYGIRVGQENDS